MGTIREATDGKKATELKGDLQEFKALGLKMSNVIASMNIIYDSPASPKKGYALGWLKTENDNCKIRRGVLEILYNEKHKK